MAKKPRPSVSNQGAVSRQYLVRAQHYLVEPARLDSDQVGLVRELQEVVRCWADIDCSTRLPRLLALIAHGQLIGKEWAALQQVVVQVQASIRCLDNRTANDIEVCAIRPGPDQERIFHRGMVASLGPHCWLLNCSGRDLAVADHNGHCQAVLTGCSTPRKFGDVWLKLFNQQMVASQDLEPLNWAVLVLPGSPEVSPGSFMSRDYPRIIARALELGISHPRLSPIFIS